MMKYSSSLGPTTSTDFPCPVMSLLSATPDFDQQRGRVLTNLRCQVWAAGKVIIALATWEKWFKIMMMSVVLDILTVSNCELRREMCTWRLGERVRTAIAVGIHRLIVLAPESHCCFNTYCVLDIVRLVPFYFQVFLFFMQYRYIFSFLPFLLFLPPHPPFRKTEKREKVENLCFRLLGMNRAV